MARPLRIEFAGGVYHVMSRGNARQDIVGIVGEHFGQDTTRWSPGRRSDDASRAVAAYPARRRFGYPAGEVAKALGYRSAGSITRAVARVEPGNERLKRTAVKLERKRTWSESSTNHYSSSDPKDDLSSRSVCGRCIAPGALSQTAVR